MRQVERKDAAHRRERHVEQHDDRRKRGSKRQIQEHEDDADRDRYDHHEPFHGPTLVLELAAPRQIVAFGEVHHLLDHGLRVLHEGPHVTPFDVALESQKSSALLAVDLSSSRVDVNLG